MASPHVQNAGDDCVATMAERKHCAYSTDEHIQLWDQGITYRTVVLSAYGHYHPDADRLLTHFAHRAARHAGLRSEKRILRHAHAWISVAIWSHAAAILLCCLREGQPLDVIAGGGAPPTDDSDDDDDVSLTILGAPAA